MYPVLHNNPNRKSHSLRDLAKSSLPVIIMLVGIACAVQSAAASTLLQVSPISLSFGSRSEYRTSTQTVTLSNSGTTSVAISSVSVTGGSFSASALALPLTLAADHTAALSVTFAPATLGALTGTISIVSSATNSPATVALSGTGVIPQLRVYATGSFGSITAGSVSTHTVTLHNPSTVNVTVTQVPVTGANFSVSGVSLPLTVAGGQTVTFNAVFAPASAGNFTGGMSVVSNANDSPSCVSLSGVGVAAASTAVASLSPASLTFASQTVGTTSSAQTVSLTNTGTASLTIANLALAGTNAGDFAQTNTCGSSLAAGGSCTISVTFKPSASGARTASASIGDNATGSPQTVSFSGTGASSVAAASLSTTSLAFGAEPVATASSSETLTLTNTGNAALTISGMTITGTNASDFAETNTCGSSLAAGAHCVIAVMFTPSSCKTRTGSLTITDNASGSPQTVSLTGTGNHDVILSWTASGSSGVMGYNVYRGTTTGGESATPVNSTPINSATFTDQNVTSGATYYYVVTAVGSDGTTQSAASNEAPAVVP